MLKQKRSTRITAKIMNKKYFIYNGKILVKFKVIPGCVGFKFGDFIFTRVVKVKK